MVSKLHFSISFKLFFFLTFSILFFCSNDANAQCAGSDNILTICDIVNPISQNVDLNVLLGVHSAGGTWKDDDKSGGLNKTTGILNAQQIRKSGVYRYTYTVSGIPGCIENTATITVTIGGYTGVPAPTSSICSSETTYNLFQVFNGNFLAPQIGGTWTDNDGSGGLDSSTGILNASVPISDKTYSYTYKIPAIGSCPAPAPVQISVSIYRSPQSGNPSDLHVCSGQLNGYTNLDLNNQLTGEDTNGTWAEPGTNEISDDTDSIINLQNIYNTRGAGTYNFTYTVFSDNAVCEDKSSIVSISIEKQLDFTGATLIVNSDICENEISTATYSAVLTQGSQSIPDGFYEVTYTISGTAIPIKTIQPFLGGVLVFSISSANFQQVQDYTISIIDVKEVNNLGICSSIIGTVKDVLHVYPIPKINNGTLTITPICQNFDALISFSGPSNLADGSYNILYNINGSNTATAIAEVLNITGGLGSFSIPKTLIPNAGTSTIVITNITNSVTGCTNTAVLSKYFTTNPTPDVTNLAVTIKNICQGQTADVKLSGLGTLTTISIDYILSGVNTLGTQTISLAAVAGEVSFVIPATNIPNVGLTSFTITNITNTITGCSLSINKKVDFTVNPQPNIPNAIDQKFCSSDNATVANLIPQGNQYKWYDSLTSTTALTPNKLLVTGNYYVKEMNATACESGATTLSVLINTIQIPVLKPNGEKFCGIDKPTILNLSNNTIASENLTWYDAAANGTILPNTNLLLEGTTYYGFDYDAATQCYSNPLAVTVSLTDCTVTSDKVKIPDGFSPNGDNRNDTFQIIDIEFSFPNYILEIFNRYGNILFKGDINKPAWDGKNSNSGFIDGDAPAGVYFYIIHFNKDNLPPKQGQLYLNR